MQTPRKRKTIAKTAKTPRNLARPPQSLEKVTGLVEKMAGKLRETAISLSFDAEMSRAFKEMPGSFEGNPGETPKLKEIIALELDVDNSLVDCLKSLNKISLILREKALAKGVLF